MCARPRSEIHSASSRPVRASRDSTYMSTGVLILPAGAFLKKLCPIVFLFAMYTDSTRHTRIRLVLLRSNTLNTTGPHGGIRRTAAAPWAPWYRHRSVMCNAVAWLWLVLQFLF